MDWRIKLAFISLAVLWVVFLAAGLMGADYRVINSPEYEEWFWICL